MEALGPASGSRLARFSPTDYRDAGSSGGRCREPSLGAQESWRQRAERLWRKRVKHRVAQMLFRVDRRRIVETLTALGVERGATLCVHSSLSRLGHVVGGADTLIAALMEAIGPEGTLMMPSFPSAGSMQQRLDSGETFDVRESPSLVGHVTEVFRRRPDVMRSLHPTHAVCAWGSRAESLLDGHERSPTPYGDQTPYGRLAAIPDARILMLETHVQSFLHHLQERVEFPNLFLDGEREAVIVDRKGVRRTVRTRAMRRRVPYFVAIPGSRDDGHDWALLHDFALMFPCRRPRIARRAGYRFDGFPPIASRRRDLVASGDLRIARLGFGDVGLLRVEGFVARVEPELRGLIDRFRGAYDPERILALGLPFR